MALLTDDSLLDAAEACFTRLGVAGTTMDAVADAAGVSRGLVYKRFHNRNGLILAVLVRRAEAFIARAKASIEACPTLTDALVDGILLAVRMAAKDPYFAMLVVAATTDPASRVEGASAHARRLSEELWRPVLELARLRGELSSNVEVGDVIDWIMLLEILLLAARTNGSSDEITQERQLRTLFIPSVVNCSREGALVLETSNAS